MSSSSTNKAPLENLSMIVAMDHQGGIGKNNKLPWGRIKGDLPRFKELTKDSVMIMGRKTFESLPGLLPNRKHIVISRNSNELRLKYPYNPDLLFYPTLESAIRRVSVCTYRHFFIVGGAEIYTQALPYVSTVYVTRINAVHEADTFFRCLTSAGGDIDRFMPLVKSKVHSKEGKLTHAYMTYLNKASVKNNFLSRLIASLKIKKIDGKFK